MESSAHVLPLPGGRAVEKGNLSRRGFLQQSLVGMAAAGLPLWYAREALAFEQEVAAARGRKIGPNDRIQIGVIGSGDPLHSGAFLYGQKPQQILTFGFLAAGQKNT